MAKGKKTIFLADELLNWVLDGGCWQFTEMGK
jgi:hypothetical protein